MPIKSVNPSGFLAVNPAGHLVTLRTEDLKDGFRWATDDDIAAVEKAEAERAAKEARAAKATGGPLAGA